MAGDSPLASVDANVLVYALNRRAPEHEAARSFLERLAGQDNVVLAEQTLVEVYLLLRNPAIFRGPCLPRLRQGCALPGAPIPAGG